jgi:tetratricopeptide (TPR) repeat protein
MSEETESGPRASQESPSPRRRVPAFLRGALISALLALTLLALLELALVLLGVQPILYVEDPYVGFASHIPLFAAQTDPDGRPVMATARNKLNLFNPQTFPAVKAEGACRVFCLGGSTTYGRPYDDATSFCGWLRAMLPEADQTRSWEVINAGGISYASYRAARLMEELAGYEPDVFVIYTGHNEFLEERTYRDLTGTSPLLRDAGAILARTRLFTVARKIRAAESGTDDEGRPRLEDEVDAILDNSVGPAAYHRDDEFRAQALDHFRFNIVRMIDIAESVGAQVILITPASNLRDCAPFKSEHRAGLTEEERLRWETAFTGAREALKAAEWGRALSHLDAALVIDDPYAELHYQRGRALWNLNRYDEAKAAFIRARDEDICPLRALTPMRAIVTEMAAERGVPLVDFAAWTESNSPHEAPGAELFLDHVHPTIEAHRQLALALLQVMADKGMVEIADRWDDAAIASVHKAVVYDLDTHAHAAALRNQAKVMGWAGKFEEACRLAREAAQMNPDDAEAHYHLAENAAELGRTDEAIRAYREAVRARPGYARAHMKLGNALSARGQSEEAVWHYEQALGGDAVFAALAHNNLGNEFSAMDKPHEAVRHYGEAIRLRPGYAEAHSNLGLTLAALGRRDEAVAQYRQAVALEPDFYPARYNLGLALAAQGKHDEAIKHLRKVVHGMPDYAPAHYHLGEAFAAVGEPAEALKHFQEAVRLQPNYAAAQEALARHPRN